LKSDLLIIYLSLNFSVYTRLNRPDWPATGMPDSVTRRQVIDLAEERLRSFSRDKNIQLCLLHFAKVRQRERVIEENAIRELLLEIKLLEFSKSSDHLNWEQEPGSHTLSD